MKGIGYPSATGARSAPPPSGIAFHRTRCWQRRGAVGACYMAARYPSWDQAMAWWSAPPGWLRPSSAVGWCGLLRQHYRAMDGAVCAPSGSTCTMAAQGVCYLLGRILVEFGCNW